MAVLCYFISHIPESNTKSLCNSKTLLKNNQIVMTKHRFNFDYLPSEKTEILCIMCDRYNNNAVSYKYMYV